jgi:RNA polymerase sigma-70 factor (ECF subfamily)
VNEAKSLSEGPLDAATVRRLVDTHREFLAFLERRVGDRALAEDILQDAFVRGIDKVKDLANEEAAIAWFFRILRNAVTDHYRRDRARQRRLEHFKTELERELDPATETHGAVCQCVSWLAATLKPEYESALRRVEVDGLPVKDYASEAGISAGNAAVRVFRARQALKKQVARCCGSCADHGCLDCSCNSAPQAQA